MAENLTTHAPSPPVHDVNNGTCDGSLASCHYSTILTHCTDISVEMNAVIVIFEGIYERHFVVPL